MVISLEKNSWTKYQKCLEASYKIKHHMSKNRERKEIGKVV